ncbi:hypothetical protein E4T48_01339 [Aureobasidium sp. EXF-10727]|nr:hypothetical protein E4T48_01339 [Aureobasidium sp. EXF-10727]
MSPSRRKSRPHTHVTKQKVSCKFSGAFELLPVEIRQSIASYIDDKSITSYRLICRSTKHALDEDEGSFWRTRYLDSYDPPQNLPIGERSVVNEWFKKQYQCRKRVERQRFDFQAGNSKKEMECLSLMRDLINESFHINPHTSKQPPTHSRNMNRLESITKATGLLECVFRRPYARGKKSIPNPVLLTVQLVLTHLSLTASPTSKIAKAWGFSDSQSLVYAQNSKRPIFRGPNCQEIDIEWTLHVANFFKNHLLNQHELTHLLYHDLAATERPQCWTKPLSTTPLKLGKHWKGSYAYVDHDEIVSIRDGQNEDYPIPDHMSGDGTGQPFQDLCLDFPKEDLDSWPAMFEHILKSRTKIQYRTATTRAQRRVTGSHVLPEGEPVSFCFKGRGEDASEGFLASGYFNPLPPQHGIPGWHRMTMMKYWKDEQGDIDFSSLWAYEGVLLPGGMVMLGRWWHPSGGQDEYSGPFIFWNVDASMSASD